MLSAEERYFSNKCNKILQRKPLIILIANEDPADTLCRMDVNSAGVNVFYWPSSSPGSQLMLSAEAMGQTLRSQLDPSPITLGH